jgi:DNA-binding response OmpR family regulator
MGTELEGILPKILVVDDQEPLRRFIRGVLTRAGYVVVEASCGEDAYRMAQAQNIDMVIADVFMPVMSGIELTDKLASGGIECPCLLITGAATTSAFGNRPILRKPFSPDALVERVRTVLSRPAPSGKGA